MFMKNYVKGFMIKAIDPRDDSIVGMFVEETTIKVTLI